MMWASTTEATDHWPDASSISIVALERLLEAATEQCAEYAPAVTNPISARYVLACVYQARELYAASQRGEQDIIGIGDYAIRARPLTAAVKQLLRPKRPTWTVG